VPPTILPLSGLAWTSCDASEHRRCAALRKSRQTDTRLTKVRSTSRRCSGAFASASGFRDDELPEPRDEPLTGPAAAEAIEPMIGLSKLATIECSTCSALLEVYPQAVPGEPSLGWSALDDGHLCKALPLRRCPHARTEIKLRFPSVDM
jgi:hypothetical protein